MRTVFLALALATAAPAAAQPAETPAAPTIEGIAGVRPAGPPPPADQVAAIAREIGADLRCPVCQGLSVADSTSAAATQMQRRIEELVAAGYSREQIEDYFVSKYGEWVLLRPRGLAVWLAPLALLAVALGAAGAWARNRTEPPAADPDPDTQVDETSAGDPEEDRHIARLLAEVDDD